MARDKVGHPRGMLAVRGAERTQGLRVSGGQVAFAVQVQRLRRVAPQPGQGRKGVSRLSASTSPMSCPIAVRFIPL